jgi:hypothetical protein
MFHHRVNESTIVGTDFGLDYAGSSTSSRIGLIHRFNDTTVLKAKVNEAGLIHTVLKFQLCSKVHGHLTHSYNLRDVFKGDTTISPIGWQFEFKA